MRFSFFLKETLSITCQKLAYCLKNDSDRLRQEQLRASDLPNSFAAFLFILSLRKQPTFCDAARHWFSHEMTAEKRAQTFILMTHHYQDLGSASNWLKISLNPNQKHYPWNGYEISVLVSQTSFRGETSGGVAKCQLITEAYAYFPQQRPCSRGTWRIFETD